MAAAEAREARIPGWPRRLRLIDGLRGIAALAVVLAHEFDGPYKQILPPATPRPLRFFFHQGLNGVAIFFVISGFVIAHSLRDAAARPGYYGRFILRRQLRLDPPYWTALLIILGTLLVAAAGSHSDAGLPSPGRFLIHVFYLQEITHQYNLMPVSWTLCLEIMFYLAFMALLFCRENLPARLRTLWTVVMTAGPAALGLLYFTNPFVWPHFPWLMPYWPLFVAGMWTYWVIRGEFRPWALFLLWAFYLAAAWVKGEVPLFWTCATSALIYAAHLCGKLDGWLISRPFQFLGRISYSLYLVHVTVIALVLDYLFAHESHTVPAAWAALTAALLASVGSAWCFYLCIEKPSVKLSARFKA